MLRFAQLIGIFLGVCALAVSVGCSRADKDRVCQEHLEVMGEFYGAAGDMEKTAAVLRKGAKVLEGLGGVPEVDAYRRDMETMAAAIDALLENGSSATAAYEQAIQAMRASADGFAKYCYK